MRVYMKLQGFGRSNNLIRPKALKKKRKYRSKPLASLHATQKQKKKTIKYILHKNIQVLNCG